MQHNDKVAVDLNHLYPTCEKRTVVDEVAVADDFSMFGDDMSGQFSSTKDVLKARLESSRR